LAPQIAKFARQHNGLPLPLESLAQDLFVVAIIVVRRVNEIDPQIAGAVENVDGQLFAVVIKLADEGRQP